MACVLLSRNCRAQTEWYEWPQGRRRDACASSGSRQKGHGSAGELSVQSAFKLAMTKVLEAHEAP